MEMHRFLLTARDPTLPVIALANDFSRGAFVFRVKLLTAHFRHDPRFRLFDGAGDVLEPVPIHAASTSFGNGTETRKLNIAHAGIHSINFENSSTVSADVLGFIGT